MGHSIGHFGDGLHSQTLDRTNENEQNYKQVLLTTKNLITTIEEKYT